MPTSDRVIAPRWIFRYGQIKSPSGKPNRQTGFPAIRIGPLGWHARLEPSVEGDGLRRLSFGDVNISRIFLDLSILDFVDHLVLV